MCKYLCVLGIVYTIQICNPPQSSFYFLDQNCSICCFLHRLSNMLLMTFISIMHEITFLTDVVIFEICFSESISTDTVFTTSCILVCMSTLLFWNVSNFLQVFDMYTREGSVLIWRKYHCILSYLCSMELGANPCPNVIFVKPLSLGLWAQQIMNILILISLFL